MILGIGTDLVEVDRIRRSLEKFGDRFLQRILLPEEVAYCQSYRHAAIHVAARFAAKEAVAKAFGTGIGSELSWLDIEVIRRKTGEPAILLHGAGHSLMEQRGVSQVLLSLSHTEHYATAVVIIEGRLKDET